MPSKENMVLVDEETNTWRDTETERFYVGREGQTIDSILEEDAASAEYWASHLNIPTLADYTAAIAGMLDAKAKERRYDNAVSIATYAGSSNAQWAAEAQAFVAWRDQVWGYCYAELDKVQNGERQQPSVSDFLTELETQFPMTWPA
ncbi:hypothetical protein G6L00_06005 [Agrobacterium rhizogenes]|nr:hypothetical protein [Rhizobium rhizogenes]